MSKRNDLSESDFQGLSHAHSERVSQRLALMQDYQPSPRTRWGWVGPVLALIAILAGYNAPAIFNAIRDWVSA